MGCCAKFGLFFQQRHFAQRSRDCLQWTCLTRRLRWGRLLRPLNPSNPQPCRPFVKVRPRCCKRRTWASTSPLCSEMSLRGYRRQGSVQVWYLTILLCGKVLQYYVTERFTAVDMPRPCLTLIPQCSLKEFWVPLTKFSTSKDAKNGSGDT